MVMSLVGEWERGSQPRSSCARCSPRMQAFCSGCESSYAVYKQLLTQCIFLCLPLSLYEKGPRICQRNFPLTY